MAGKLLPRMAGITIPELQQIPKVVAAREHNARQRVRSKVHKEAPALLHSLETATTVATTAELQGRQAHHTMLQGQPVQALRILLPGVQVRHRFTAIATAVLTTETAVAAAEVDFMAEAAVVV